MSSVPSRLDILVIDENIIKTTWLELQAEYLSNSQHKLIIKDKGVFHIIPNHESIPESFKQSIFWNQKWEILFKDGTLIQTDEQLKLVWNGVMDETVAKHYEIVDNVKYIKQLPS